MSSRFLGKISQLDLEEKILNIGVVLTLIGVFLPWIGGRWLGEESRTHTGLGFYTSYIGIAVLLLNAYMLCIALVPLFSKTQLVRKAHKAAIRLSIAATSTVLLVASLSVLLQVTFEFRSM